MVDLELVAIAGWFISQNIFSGDGTSVLTNVLLCREEGHISKECDKPRNPDTVTCRNCEEGEETVPASNQPMENNQCR